MATETLPASSRGLPPSSRGLTEQRSVGATYTGARFLAPLGRLLFSLVFLAAIPGHFTSQGVQYAAAQGIPAAGFLVPFSGALALIGALSVLLGFHARIGAALLVLFLVPVTLGMHRFWNVADPAMAQLEQVMFLKNVGLTGAALLIAYFGAGPVSLDASARHPLRRTEASGSA